MLQGSIPNSLPINYKAGLYIRITLPIIYKKLKPAQQSITYNLTAHVLSPRIFNYELKQSNSTTCWKL